MKCSPTLDSAIGKSNRKIRKYQTSKSHREAIDLVIKIPSATKDVGDMLNKSHAEQKDENWQVLLKIFSSVRYLGGQGIAFRDRWKTDDPEILNGESDSHFILLLRIRAEDNTNLQKWMDKCQDKLTSPDIQNEILKLMSLRILRDIVQEISAKLYTIIVDETTDLSNIEQMVLVLRHVDDDFNVHEELIVFYSVESTPADNTMLKILDILLRLNLSINNCRGQCYDGASIMSGIPSGVATKVSSLKPRALYTHCYGHALNLAVQDGINGTKVMDETLSTIYEITKLIKKSPKKRWNL